MDSSDFSSETENTKRSGKKESSKKKGIKSKSVINERAIKGNVLKDTAGFNEKPIEIVKSSEINRNQINGVTLLCDNGTFINTENDKIATITSINERDSRGDNQNDNNKDLKSYSIVQNINSENDDWEKMFDEGSVGLDESSLENLSEIVCDMSISSENQPESDGSSIIEIYGFPEEFKTQDIMKSFTTFVNRGFKLRWVDDTHALGIFPSSSLADEALATHLPFVKTRPLSQASEASKSKAKCTVLPSSMRPKTCTGLARRLVSSALGIKNIVSPAERQAELQVLREAKEQKRLAAKQREAAWEGRF